MCSGQGSRYRLTVNFFVSKFSLKDLNKGKVKISTSCVNGLGHVSDQQSKTTGDARTMLPGLSITMKSLSRSSCRILTGREVTGGSWRCTTFSMRSPLRTIVSGLATLPLIVVTPDLSAYLCIGRKTVRQTFLQHIVCKASAIKWKPHIVLYRAVTEFG